MDRGGVLERDEQPARVLNQAQDGQLARLSGQAKNQLPGAPVPDRAILAAGVDQQLGSIAWFHQCRHAKGRIVREVMKPGERRAFLRLDGRLGMGLEEAVAALAKLLERVGPAEPVQIANPPPPIDQVEKRDRVNRHHASQWVIGSNGIRSAGLKSPPVWKPTVISAACVYRSNGMPRRSATSRSYRRCSVVQAVPSPRARAASMKLQAAGRIEPYRPAISRLETPGRCTRPSMQGMTITGTSCIRSARYWADAATRGSCFRRGSSLS